MMLNRESLAQIVTAISALMSTNRNRLIELDQVNGDGDLGISMDDGFRATADYLTSTEETDLGQLLRKGSRVFNEAAPSSLGTILSFGFMGMARALRGSTQADILATAGALHEGIDAIMTKAESKPGEKTILDALVPAVAVIRDGAEAARGDRDAVRALLVRAAQAAADGSQATRQMEAVHGRAAYSAARSIGVLDAGSVVGRLIFEAVADWAD